MADAGKARIEWVKQLSGEETPQSRRALFESHREWHDAETLVNIHAELIRCMYADQPRARRLGEIARWAAEAAGDPFSLATGLRCEGHVHYSEARYEASIEAYRQALALLDANESEAGRIYVGGLLPLIYLGRYEEAHQWAERAKKIFQRHNDVSRLARLAVNVGNIYFRQDRYEEALKHHQEALPVLEQSSEPQDYAVVLSNIATCCIYLGQFHAALEHYQTVRTWCEKHKLQALVAGADYNIAYLHYLRGDYLKARELYSVSRQHCAEASDAYYEALCDLDESEMLLELNLVADAGQLAEKAAASFEHLGLNYERAKATVNQAVASFRRGDSGRAHKLFHKARQLLAREDNRYWRAILDLYQALVKEQEGAFKEARKYSEQALQVLAFSPLTGKAALCHSLLARLYTSEGNYEAARRELREMERTQYSPALRFHWHYLNATLLERCGEFDRAEAEYGAAIQLAEESRKALWVEELKIAFLRDKTEMYAAATRLSLRHGHKGEEDAFLWVQRAKSRSLLESLHDVGPEDAQSIAVESDEIAELRRDLTANYRRLEAAAAASRAPANETLRTLRQRVQKGEQQLLKAWGEAQPANGTPADGVDFLPAEIVQRTLRPDAALVEFFAVGDRMHAWILTGEKLEHVKCGHVAQMRESFRFLQFQLGKFALGPDHATRFHGASLDAARVHLRELHQSLIEPLGAKLGKQRLIFAPTGFLHHVPFHALLDENGTSLIDTHIVSYAPSASIFARSALRPPANATRSLIIAAPDQTAPRIEQEAMAIRELLKDSELLMGNGLSLEDLKKYCADRRYLHLAAHGLLRQDNPQFSAIKFGETRLHLFDLRTMKLQAELVTLSGCSTGVSAVVGADELVGLMRGVLGAGARGLLASLWDVNDESSTRFMISFYRHMAENGMADPASAVREAMLEVRETHSHVYYWAPFALVCGEQVGNKD